MHTRAPDMGTRTATRLVYVTLIAAATPSCAFVLSQEHYRPVDRDELTQGVSAHTPTVQLGFIWFIVGAQQAG